MLYHVQQYLEGLRLFDDLLAAMCKTLWALRDAGYKGIALLRFLRQEPVAEAQEACAASAVVWSESLVIGLIGHKKKGKDTTRTSTRCLWRLRVYPWTHVKTLFFF